MRLTKLAVAAVSLTAIVPAGAEAAKPRTGCPIAFTAATLEQLVAHPRTQGAISAGLTTAAGAIAAYQVVDRNADGVLCYQVPTGFVVSKRPLGEYYLNVIDNRASVPSG